jgi:hypothetical protein
VEILNWICWVVTKAGWWWVKSLTIFNFRNNHTFRLNHIIYSPFWHLIKNQFIQIFFSIKNQLCIKGESFIWFLTLLKKITMMILVENIHFLLFILFYKNWNFLKRKKERNKEREKETELISYWTEINWMITITEYTWHTEYAIES